MASGPGRDHPQPAPDGWAVDVPRRAEIAEPEAPERGRGWGPTPASQTPNDHPGIVVGRLRGPSRGASTAPNRLSTVRTGGGGWGPRGRPWPAGGVPPTGADTPESVVRRRHAKGGCRPSRRVGAPVGCRSRGCRPPERSGSGPDADGRRAGQPQRQPSVGARRAVGDDRPRSGRPNEDDGGSFGPPGPATAGPPVPAVWEPPLDRRCRAPAGAGRDACALDSVRGA